MKNSIEKSRDLSYVVEHSQKHRKSQFPLNFKGLICIEKYAQKLESLYTENESRIKFWFLTLKLLLKKILDIVISL